MESTSHVVGHLYREIESSIRAVLRPLSDGGGASSAKRKGHEAEVRTMLRSLGIGEEDDAGAAWLRIVRRGDEHGLHRRAHRDNLAAPRPVDEGYLEDIADLDHVLHTVLGKIEQRYLGYVDQLDALLAKQLPGEPDARRLQQEFPQDFVTLEYFFSRASARWMGPLVQKSFFTRLPPLEIDLETGRTAFPAWPCSRYLSRIAEEEPEKVMAAIRSVPPTENILIHQDLAEAVGKACSTCPASAAEWAEQEARWVAQQEHLGWLLPEKLAELAARLAASCQARVALELVTQLLDIMPDPEQEEKMRKAAGDDEPIFARAFFSPNPGSRASRWDYDHVIQAITPLLAENCGPDYLGLLGGLLKKAIDLSRFPDDRTEEDAVHQEWVEDYSYIWRKAVEYGSRPADDIKDALVTAVRDVAELLAEAGDTHVLQLVENKRWTYKVFGRIGLHLRRKSPQLDEHGTKQMLADRSIWEDPAFRHELWRLSEAAAEQFASDSSWKTKYDRLCQEFGEPAEPEPTVRLHGPACGIQSPVTREELAAKSMDELTSFLVANPPSTQDPLDSLFEGVGPVLGSLIESDPGRFAGHAGGLGDLHVALVGNVFHGFQKAAAGKSEFDWQPVLRLAAASVRRVLDETATDSLWLTDKAGRYILGAVAELMAKGLKEEGVQIPFGLRDEAWAALEPLLSFDDLATTSNPEEVADPAGLVTTAINSVQGKSVEALFEYALWIARDLVATRKEDAAVSLADMDEVSNAFHRLLEKASLPLRALFGMWLPWLIKLDVGWVERNRASLFPTGDNALFEATWGGYIHYCEPYNQAFMALRGEYSRAIGLIPRHAEASGEPSDVDQRLGNHLITQYWRGQLGLESALLRGFYVAADEPLRAHVIEFVGRSLRRTEGDVPETVLTRLRDFWKWRVREVGGSGVRAKELSPYGWWFVSGKFEEGWALEQLDTAVRVACELDPIIYEVAERLAEIAKERPRDAVQALDLIVEHLPHHRVHWIESAKAVIEEALRSDDRDARATATVTINRLAERGHLELRELHSAVAGTQPGVLPTPAEPERPSQ